MQDRRLRGELFEKYIPELAESLAKLTDKQKAKIIAGLELVLKKNNVIMQEAEAEEDKENGEKVEENG
jgi:DNA topoisomerase VI subunit B